MVVKLTTGHESKSTTYSTSSSSSKTTMASSVETPSWSKMYGRDRRHTYKSPYGRMTSYEPASSRFSSESSMTTTSTRQSRYDTTPRSRMTASVDRDLDFQRGEEIISSFAKQSGLSSDMYSRRRAYSVDRDAGFGQDLPTRSASKARPWREKLKLAEAKRRASETTETLAADYRSRRGSADRGFSRSYSIDSSSTTPRRSSRYDYEVDYQSTYERAPRKSRAASLSRAYGDSSIDYEGIIAQAQRKRSASLSRYDDNDLDVEHGRVVHKGVPVKDLAVYNDDTISFDQRVASTRNQDLTSFVLRPGERFEPEKVKVWELPSGRKAVTYSTFNEYGHGDRREANAKIAEATLRTQVLEQSMSGLEDFVKRNRSYFPDETTIYQQIRFYQLNEEQLREIGERPDAEVYGVKVREKLCVPPGTDVGHILRRYYKSSDVDVEYSTGTARATGEEYEVKHSTDVQQNIRRQVEAEFDMRDKQRILGDESYDVRSATRYQARQEEYNHMHPHVTPTYIQSVYRDAGLNYDDIYQRSPSMTSPPTSLGSDLESLRSSTSSRRRTYDMIPNFTAKLRDKQCMAGQTIKFNCSVSGTPFPDISWFKGNKQLSTGGRFTFSNNYGLLSLEIADVIKDDAGLYCVKAINPEGEVACSASLDVIEVDYGYQRDGSQKPYFIVEAANTAAEVEGDAVFEARAVGKPAPSFKWAKDNILLSEGPRIRMYDNSQGNAKLVIRDIGAEDHGLYFLTAENKAGKAKCAATLRVVERGQLDDRRRSASTEPLRRQPSWSRELTPTLDLPPRKEKGLKPWFVQMPPVEVKLREGETLTLKAMVDGDPKPVVTWCKGVRELQYTERHRVVTEADHYMMQIKQTTALDRGQYIVIAENALGRIHANCWVNVLPIGEDEEAADIEFRRFKLELPELDIEAVTKGEASKQAPMFVKRLPRERTVSAGSLLELKCVVREATPEIITDTSYKTRVKGKLELQEETIKIAADGTVTKKTAVVDLDKPAEAAKPEAEKVTTEAKSEAPATEEVVVSKKPPIPKAGAKPAASEKEASPPPATTAAPAEAAKPEEKKEDVVVEVVSAEPAAAAAAEPIPVVEEPHDEESAPIKVVSEVLAESSSVKVEEVVEVPVVVEAKKAVSKPWDDASSEESSSEEEEIKKSPTKPAVDTTDAKAPVVEEPVEVEEAKAEPAKEEAPKEEAKMEVKPEAEKVEMTMVATTSEEPKAEEVKVEEPKAVEVKVEEAAPEAKEETKTEEPVVEVKEEKEEVVVEVKAEPVVEETKAEVKTSEPESLPSQPDEPESKVKSESEGGLPFFEEKLRNIMVPEGASATFSCSINESSNASVVWTKDGQDISTKTNITASSEACVHSLVISNVSKSDEGCYMCTAKNNNGTSTSSGTLTVENLQKAEQVLASPESITKGYISALDQPEKKKKKKKEKKDKGTKSEKGGEPKVEEVVAAEEEKPKEEEATEEETKPTKAASTSPQDSEEESASSDESDSDSDSDSESETESSDSESDSEFVIVETKHKEAKLRVAHVELGMKMLPQSDLSVTPGSVISVQCQVSDDPLRETLWLCEGRQ